MMNQRDVATEGLQAVRAYVGRPDFRTDPEISREGFKMWMESARVRDYDDLDLDHIFRLAASRRHTLIEGQMGEHQIQSLLCADDFDIFLQNANGAYEPTGGMSRLEAFARVMSLRAPLQAVQIALFASVTNPWSIGKEELRWIIYLFNSQFDVAQVYAMTKAELVGRYSDISKDCLTEWPKIRDSIQTRDGLVPPNSIDVGYRSLRRLQEMCERLAAEEMAQMFGLEAPPPVTNALTQTASESWNREQSLIVNLIEIEGGGASQGRRRGDITEVCCSGCVRYAWVRLRRLECTHRSRG
jgi:hypothetical protein